MDSRVRERCVRSPRPASAGLHPFDSAPTLARRKEAKTPMAETKRTPPVVVCAKCGAVTRNAARIGTTYRCDHARQGAWYCVELPITALACVLLTSCNAPPAPDGGFSAPDLSSFALHVTTPADVCARNGMPLATHRGQACVAVMERVVGATEDGAGNAPWATLRSISSGPDKARPTHPNYFPLGDPNVEHKSVESLTEHAADGAMLQMEELYLLAQKFGHELTPAEVRGAAVVGATGIDHPQ